MPKLKVIIIEDEFFAANHLRKLLRKLDYLVVAVYYSGEAFFKEPPEDFDAAIVDIQLSKEKSGLDVATELKQQHKPFIFLTANKEQLTLLEAAKLKPAAYISKPFKVNDVSAALEIIRLSLPQRLRIRTNRGVEYLLPEQILFVKADDSYVDIITLTGSVIQRKLLKDVLDELPSYFIRVHRSYAVNGQYVEAQNAGQLLIKEHKIPISRNLKIDWANLSM